MSWLVTAGVAVVGGGIYSAVSANQKKQRNKGYIQQSYDTARAKLDRDQENIRQGTTSDLNRRGLAQGGLSPIHAAMIGHAGTDAVTNTAITTPHSLGEQQQVDNEHQFENELTEIAQQRAQAEHENKAAYIDSLVSTGVNTVAGLAGVKAAQQERNDTKTKVDAPQAAGTTSPIYGALSGIEHPTNWAGGVIGGDPLNKPGSSWNRRTANGNGLENDDFHE